MAKKHTDFFQVELSFKTLKVPLQIKFVRIGLRRLLQTNGHHTQKLFNLLLLDVPKAIGGQ